MKRAAASKRSWTSAWPISPTIRTGTRTSGAPHFLVDGAKDGGAGGVEHFDAHAIAEAQEGRARRTRGDGFEHAGLGQAGGTARAVGVGDGARADDRAGAKLARARAMRDQRRKIKG